MKYVKCDYAGCEREAIKHLDVCGEPFMGYCRKHAEKVKVMLRR